MLLMPERCEAPPVLATGEASIPVGQVKHWLLPAPAQSAQSGWQRAHVASAVAVQLVKRKKPVGQVVRQAAQTESW